MKMKKALLSALFAVATIAVATAQKPRLVVNIVVPQLSASDLRPLQGQLSADGLGGLLDGGVRYDYAYYPFVPTCESALAALSTGATPALSGIVGPKWWNFTTGVAVGAVADSKSSSYDCDTDESRVSNVNLVLPTIGDALRSQSPESKSIAIATNPSSAIILGGLNPNEVWWIDSLGARWTTSTKYLAQLPRWVKNHNAEGGWRRTLARPWVLTKGDDQYHATKSSIVRPQGYQLTRAEQQAKPKSKDLRKATRSYVANDMVADFVREAVIYNALGGDEHTDLLSVCFDAPARVAAIYGTDSREWEDMIYRLDRALAEMKNFVAAQCDGQVVWVLTSDGGSEKVVDPSRAQKFVVDQFMFLLGTYMNANYGKGDWILGHSGGAIWLNRNLVRSKGLDIESVQRGLAQFALQYGGVSHVAVQADMVSGGVKSGVAELLQEGFYPRRSADLVVVLMPGWVMVPSEDSQVPKCYGATIYDASRRTLLSISGFGVEARKAVVRKVDACSLVPTLARLVGIDNPTGASAEPLVEVFE